MSKHINPQELAEIVAALLTNPSLLGELDSREKHQQFMLGIGSVVSDFCGGQIDCVIEPDTTKNYLSDDYSCPYLVVSPDENIPSLESNVWAHFDVAGWQDEVEIDIDEAQKVADAVRSEIRKCFANNSPEKKAVASKSTTLNSGF